MKMEKGANGMYRAVGMDFEPVKVVEFVDDGRHEKYLASTEFDDGMYEISVGVDGARVDSHCCGVDMPDDVARKLLDALTRYFADKDGNDE